MSKIIKYTFFLRNGNRIVLTDELNPELQLESLSRFIKNRKLTAFKTKTDLVLLRPEDVVAIHITNLGTKSNDKLNEDEFDNTNSEEDTEELITPNDENSTDVDNSNNEVVYEDEPEDLDENVDFFDSETFIKDFDFESEESGA